MTAENLFKQAKKMLGARTAFYWGSTENENELEVRFEARGVYWVATYSGGEMQIKTDWVKVK